MDRITVVGLGAMGLGIVQTYAQAGFKVAATDAARAAGGPCRGRQDDGGRPRRSLVAHYHPATAG
jgi:3-hydroxyacyl-CoA dehydrogenase